MLMLLMLHYDGVNMLTHAEPDAMHCYVGGAEAQQSLNTSQSSV